MDHSLELELAGDRPRPIPRSLRQGTYATELNAKIVVAFLLGAVAAAAGLSGALDTLCLTIPPLVITGWSGVAVMAIAAIVWLKDQLGDGPWRYVRQGIAAPARVVTVEARRFRKNEQSPIEVRFDVQIELTSPDGTVARHLVTSPPVPEREGPTFGAAPGDTVTAVWFAAEPGRRPEELTLYGFLGLNPDSTLVHRLAPRSAWSPVMPLVGLGIFFVGIFGMLHAIALYETLHDEGAAVAGYIGLGVGVVLAIWLWFRRPTDRIKVALFGLLIGGGMTWLFAFTILQALNGALDTSPPAYDLVEIVEFWQETHTKFGIPLLRDFSIEYRLQGEKKKKATTPAHLARFASKLGAREIHRGYFGWRWIKEIHPARPFEDSQDAVEILHDDGQVEAVTVAR